MKLIKRLLDRIAIIVIVAGREFNVDCSMNILLDDLVNKLGASSKYIYSLFNECYYSVHKSLIETEIRNGDILFL